MPTNHKEAHIQIGSTVLTTGQAMAVRVAVNDFLMSLDDKEIQDGLGSELTKAYKARLTEVARILAVDGQTTRLK